MSGVSPSETNVMERAIAPNKRWRNLWFSTADTDCEDCGKQQRAGATFWECCRPDSPSREAAEQIAQDDIDRMLADPPQTFHYIGAFEVNE